MPTFPAPDGTSLSYRLSGEGAGPPLLCLPGGPAGAAYLGVLGGLAARRPLVLLDLRGTGRSALPADPSSYRCDRLVEDVEALRRHLALPTVDLLAHSGGVNLAVRYVDRYPRRAGDLVLVAPGTRAVGIEITGGTRRALARLRSGQPWFPAAFAALETVIGGEAGEAEWQAIAPFLYGRWDEAARAHHAASQPRNAEAVARYAAEGAFEPSLTRAALAAHLGQVLLMSGEFDLNSPPSAVDELAGLLPRATHVVQPGAGHYPWLDDAEGFAGVVGDFVRPRG